jgi:hypothetical protein
MGNEYQPGEESKMNESERREVRGTASAMLTRDLQRPISVNIRLLLKAFSKRLTSVDK